MREFSQAVSLQCFACCITIYQAEKDFDIVGTWDSMIPEAEILSLLSTIFTRLEVGDFTIKVCKL